MGLQATQNKSNEFKCKNLIPFSIVFIQLFPNIKQVFRRELFHSS